MNSASNIPLGTMIKGKWHHQHYRIVKELGKGANGVVYLAESPKGQVALKVSDDSMLIASEVNVLKSFSKAPVKTMGPSFYDMDDALYPGMSEKRSFYVMEYVRGPLLLEFVKQKGDEWIVVLMIQLLSNLAHLHKEGWIFGDLKPDNLIVSGPQLRFDVLMLEEQRRREGRLRNTPSFLTAATGVSVQEKQNLLMIYLL